MFLNWKGLTGITSQPLIGATPATSVIEENPFFQPSYLGPALRYLGGAEVTALNLIAPSGDLLRAALVLEPSFRNLPIRTLSTWTHPFQFLATPLISRSDSALAITALLEVLDTLPDQPALLILNDLCLDGEFFGALRSQLAKQSRPWLELQRFERAVLRRGLTLDQHISKQLSNKRRKELERKRTELQKLGEINFDSLHNASDLDLWLDQFFTIEASGWKGRAGSALAQDAKHRDFFTMACKESYKAGSLRILRMTLSHTTVAMHISLISGRSAFAIKIAYDDAYARFSPGALLELENMHRVLDLNEFDFVDSCALPDHELFRRLWRERTTIGSIAIAADSSAARTILAGLKLTQKVRRFFKTKINRKTQ